MRAKYGASAAEADRDAGGGYSEASSDSDEGGGGGLAPLTPAQHEAHRRVTELYRSHIKPHTERRLTSCGDFVEVGGWVGLCG